MLVVARESDGDVGYTHVGLDLNEDTGVEEVRIELGPLAFITTIDRAAILAEQIRSVLYDIGQYTMPLHRAV